MRGKSTVICVACGEALPRTAFAQRFATTRGVIRPSGVHRMCIACQNAPRPMGPPPTPIADRFWPKVNRADGTTSCWLWQGACISGYGVIWRNGKQEFSHRIAWEMAVGPIPDGMIVCHACDVKPCVRNDEHGIHIVDGIEYQRAGHLFLATHAVNTRDMMAKGREGFSGEQHHQASASDAIVTEMCARYRAGGVTHQQIADEYDVPVSSFREWLYGRSRRSAHH